MPVPPRLGTVLPTRESLHATDVWFRDLQRRQRAVASSSLRAYEPRFLHGEWRYYAKPDSKGRVYYAVVDMACKVRWFLVTPDGDYAEGTPRFGVRE